jgi:predicted nucleic acid-binding protein
MATAAASVGALPSRVMLDTSVILSATDESRAEHRQALLVFGNWVGRGTTLYASGQIVREYLAVATRPADMNGLGLKQEDAVANVRAVRTRTTLLSENGKVADCLLDLLDDTRALASRYTTRTWWQRCWYTASTPLSRSTLGTSSDLSTASG